MRRSLILRLAPRPLAVGSLRTPPHGRFRRCHGFCPWGSAHGFTLIELVLTVTFFVAMMATVGGLLRLGLRAHASWGVTFAPYQAYDRAMTQLAADVAAAQPFFGLPATGSATELALPRVELVAQEDGTRAPAWVRVTYRVLSTDGGALVREVTRWQPDGPASAPETQTVLLTHIEGQFRYQVLGADGAPQWVDVWDGATAGVPRVVQFEHAVVMPPDDAPLALTRWLRNPAGSAPTVESP